jgi:hypothetical protein
MRNVVGVNLEESLVVLDLLSLESRLEIYVVMSNQSLDVPQKFGAQVRGRTENCTSGSHDGTRF